MQNKPEIFLDTYEETDVTYSDPLRLQQRFAKKQAQPNSQSKQGTDSRHRRGSRGGSASAKRPSGRRHKLSGR